MTTMAATALAVRRILNDRPERIKLGAAVSDTTDETVTTVAADIGKVGIGNILEHDDGATGAEQRRVISTDPVNLQFEAERGYGGSTAATHSNSTYLLQNPRFAYDTIAQAVNTALDSDLFQQGVFEIVRHQITSSSSTYAYNAPTAYCEEFLAVYQQTASMAEPVFLSSFSRLPTNVDTGLYAAGKFFRVNDNQGIAGDLFYVNCKHKLTISTLSASQERIVQWLAAAYLQEWTEPKRTAGPTNQGDRTVRPGQAIANAAYFRQLAQKAIADERSYLKAFNPPVRTWRRA